MSNPLAANVLETLFTEARSYPSWQAKAVSQQQLHALYDLTKWGPTSMNCLPMRLVFIQSADAKARLKPLLAEGNVDKSMAAPVTVIVAFDTQFYEHMPRLFPHYAEAHDMYADNAELGSSTAFRNSSLQGAYLIIAARSLGLDVGPMSGFDSDRLDAEFFPDGRYKANFLMNIGYGDKTGLHARGERFDFDEVCEVL